MAALGDEGPAEAAGGVCSPEAMDNYNVCASGSDASQAQSFRGISKGIVSSLAI